MNQEDKDQEAQYREEFESIPIEDHHPYGRRFSKHFQSNVYDHTHVQAQWLGYLAGRLKGQEELDLLKDHRRNNCHWKGVAIKQSDEIESLKKSRDYSRSVCEQQSNEIIELKKEIEEVRGYNCNLASESRKAQEQVELLIESAECRGDEDCDHCEAVRVCQPCQLEKDIIESLKKEIRDLNLTYSMEIRTSMDRSKPDVTSIGVALRIQDHDFKCVENSYKKEIGSLKKEIEELESSRHGFYNLEYKERWEKLKSENQKLKKEIEELKTHYSDELKKTRDRFAPWSEENQKLRDLVENISLTLKSMRHSVIDGDLFIKESVVKKLLKEAEEVLE